MSARRSRAAVVVLVCCALLAGAASALAAHPKKGARFSGSFSFTGINGFKAPVAFGVSKSGTSLTGFHYSTLGCFGSGGFQKGVDYYTKPGASHMRDVLLGAAERLDAAKEASIQNFLLDTEHDELLQKAICNSVPSLAAAIPQHPVCRN